MRYHSSTSSSRTPSHMATITQKLFFVDLSSGGVLRTFLVRGTFQVQEQPGAHYEWDIEEGESDREEPVQGLNVDITKSALRCSTDSVQGSPARHDCAKDDEHQRPRFLQARSHCDGEQACGCDVGPEGGMPLEAENAGGENQ